MDEDDRIPRTKEVTIHVKPEYYLKLAREEFEKGNSALAIKYYMLHSQNLKNPNDMKLSDQMNLTKLIMNLNTNLDESDLQDHIMKCYLAALNIFPKNALLLNAFGLYFFLQGEYTVARSYFQRAAEIGYLPGEKNFLHVIWHLIPRWHFRMLNDKNRNQCYEKAIKKAVDQGFKQVYDIGTGCGLLSLIAANSCNDVRVVAFEESRILSNIANAIFKRNGLSDNIKLISENSNTVKEPPAPCNLIVTEIFDAGVFGERCLATIRHAVNHFVKSDFKIIPASVRLYVTAFHSPEITKQYRYAETLPELNLKNVCLVEENPEPYDSDFLTDETITYMSETKPFLDVNFRDLEQLDQLESGSISEVELVCLREGLIHGFAVWFDLKLDEEVSISTHPSDPCNKCWEQAIFHLHHPVEAKIGETVKATPCIVDGQISFGVQHQCNEGFRVTKEVISFLNDSKLVSHVIKSTNGYKDSLKIVDFNIFPLFGFLMAKKGATVFHVYREECDLNFFKHLVALNGIPSNKMIFINPQAVQDFLVYLEPPDVVYTDLIKTDGSWNKVDFTLETESKFSCETVPRKIFLKAQLISSSYLDFCNKVDDNNALNFQIFAEINEYTGSEHPNLGSFDHRKHSTVATFDISDLEKFDFHTEGIITEDGTCNAILYWFDMQFTDDASDTFSTLESTHFDKTCSLLSAPKRVKKDDRVMFHIMRLEGHLKVYCDQ